MGENYDGIVIIRGSGLAIKRLTEPLAGAAKNEAVMAVMASPEDRRADLWNTNSSRATRLEFRVRRYGRGIHGESGPGRTR